jgi:N-acyl-L-homoserine lactone synthetase
MTHQAVKTEREIGAKIYHAQVVSPSDSSLFAACLRLRYDYFVREKGWVKENKEFPGHEQDRYDPFCLHLAVFEGTEPVAYLRVLPHITGLGFMLDHDFARLLSDEARNSLYRDGAIELSRLVCRANLFRTIRRGHSHPVELLFRELYSQSKQRGFAHFYAVVEEAWLKPFCARFCFPFHALEAPYTFPDGTRAVVASATVADIETNLQKHSPQKWAWYADSKG